jgi:hypothetical protein
MRFLVTPTFTEKLSSLTGEDLAEISRVVNIIKDVDRSGLTGRASGLDVRPLDTNILTIKRGKYRIYASFGSDSDGEYLLLLDIGLEGTEPRARAEFFATKDPRKNPILDPNRNMTIDPRRNMTVDPNRNMTIDPRRNMTIDPRRNMTIDPRRNMTIDPRRNMTIDPRRNMTIDPNRNMTIDPRRNRFYGGPYLYSVVLEQEGFIVRANDRVSLIFDMSAHFNNFIVFLENGFGNVFDLFGGWVGFLVPTPTDVILRFDTSGQWLGIIV